MIRYLDPLFTTAKTEAKVEKVKEKIRTGAGMIGICLITIASNQKDVFDIIPAPMMKQPSFRKRDLYVVGIAQDKDAAFELVGRIYQEYHQVYSTYTGIRDALLEQFAEQEKAH